MSNNSSHILKINSQIINATDVKSDLQSTVKFKEELHLINSGLRSEDRSEIYEAIRHKDVFLNEKFDVQYTMYAKIFSIIENDIYCECLIDEEENILEELIFDKILFQHINNISEGKIILIKVSKKPGTIKYEFFNGEGFFMPEKYFSTKIISTDFDSYPKSEPL